MENTPLPKMKEETGPLVTVAMVTYNSEEYVEVAIKSILASSYSNFELIICDDNSSDQTWEIISSFQDSRIKAIRNKENLGEYQNRNKCIDLAQGKYFIFIDGDDVLFEHGLYNYVYYAEKYPEAPLIVQKGYTNNVIFPVLLSPRTVFELEFFGNSLLTSSFVSNFFHTQILKDLGGLSHDYRAGDNYIRYLIACKFPVLFISGWNAWHRETPGQASVVIRNGIGIAEHFKLIKDFSAKGLLPLNTEEINIVIEKYKYQLTRILIKNQLKLDNNLVKRIKTVANIKLKDLRFRHPQLLTNHYASYSSSRPLSNFS